MNKKTSSLFKWSGGKSRELSKISKHLPSDWEILYEPFVGGGAFWWNFHKNKSVIGDSYYELINFYEVIKNDEKTIVDKISSLCLKYNSSKRDTKEQMSELAKEIFYFYRDNDFADPIENAIKFYVLRQLSFSGMLRFSSKGKFNVPFGWYKNFKDLQITEKHRNILQNTQIFCQSWEETIRTSNRKDIVFLDPPYTRKFSLYHPSGNFGPEEHIKLKNWFEAQQSRCVIVLNKDEFTEGLYGKWIKEEYGKKYSIQYRDRMKEEDTTAIHFIATNF